MSDLPVSRDSSASISQFDEVSSYRHDDHDEIENDGEEEEVDSLPSTATSDTDSIRGESDAEREWRESLQQLELILTMVLVPYVGKYFGRKAAYWGWARFMEWKYPVSVVVSSPGLFKAAGAVEAAL